MTDLLPAARADLHDILRAGIDSIEPGHLVFAALARGILHRHSQQRFFVVAAGKAAWPMALALESQAARELVGRRSEAVAGLVAGPRTFEADLPPNFEWFNASHPAPNAASETAGTRALALAAESRPHGVLVVLLSGGASAMLAVPAAGLSLADKVHTARALMNAGAPIAELNCVRKHLSAIKGGRLASAAAQTVTLAISDVHGPLPDDPSVIGSGPTVADPTTFEDAVEIVSNAGLISSLPRAVIAHLERGDGESPKPGDLRLASSTYHIIGNREMAMDGVSNAARARGYSVRIVLPATEGEAREAGAAFAGAALRDIPPGPLCVIGSGESTVKVRGAGRGGRNQEFVLGALAAIDSCAPRARSIVLASVGTDGIDGPTDAAGAVVDQTTSARARECGVHPDAALASNDSYDFFAALGDLIRWGATGTNVGDLHVLLVHR